MKWALYNLLFAAVYPFLLPGFLLRMLRRGGYAARMGDRFALYPVGLFGKDRALYDSHAQSDGSCGGETPPPHEVASLRGETPPPHEAVSLRGGAVSAPQIEGENFVWIHAVSVGEVQVAGQLMREWRKVEPDVRFCFSTTSSTGWKIAEKELKELNSQPQPSTSTSDILIYNPLDFPNFVKSALRTVRPRAIVLTESEIWPNFIRMAKKMGIPLFLINARVSDRSAPRYKAAKWFFGEVLSSFTRIFAQSDLDKERLVAAGAPEAKVEVTGSFKFDVAHRNEAKEKELCEWIASFDLRGRDAPAPRILLGGSTWPGEDEVLLGIYRRLLESKAVEGNRIVLVIAPRHFEKADAIEANIRKHGFACVRRSREVKVGGEGEQRKELNSTVDLNLQPQPVYLADTTGELMGLYGIADVVFVGKSLCAHGSQNMIEPCLCGKPTIVGPYTENFRPVMSDLLASEAIIQVKDAEELEEKIVELFGSSDLRGRDAPAPSGGNNQALHLGERAKAAVEKRLGVVAKCVNEIRGAL